MKIRAGEKELSNVKLCGVLLIWAVFVVVCGLIAEAALTPTSSKDAFNASCNLITLVALSVLVAGIFVLHYSLNAGKLPWLRKH